MPAVSRIKTYTKTRSNTNHNQNHNYDIHYSTSSSSINQQNSFLFPITGASIAIDSLLAKNIEKRNSSLKEETEKNIQTRNGSKGTKKEVRLLENDSFDLSINTTFEKLQKAPDLQPVNYCNVSLISGNCSSEESHLEHKKPLFKVQKTYERKVLSLGKKLKNDKSNKKTLLQLAKKTQQKTPELSPNSDNTSLIVARKFTPIASTSKLVNKLNNSVVFQPGLRHCMQAQNSPNYLTASTPIFPRHLRSRGDISLSPITAKKQLNFQSGWKSLFANDTLPSKSSKDVIFINSTLDESNKDLKFKAIPVVIIEDDLQLNTNENEREIYSPRVNLTRNSFSKYQKKMDLLQTPYIDLTRYSFTDYLNKTNKSEDSVKYTMKLRSRTKAPNKKTKTKRKSNKNEVVKGVGLRTRSQQKTNSNNSDVGVSKPKKPRTVSLKTKIKSPDYKTVRRLRSNSSVQLNKTNSSLDDSVFLENNVPTENKDSDKIKNDESIYIARILEELKRTPPTEAPVPVSVRKSSRARRKSVLIDEENYSDWGEYDRISQNKVIPTEPMLPTPEKLKEPNVTVSKPILRSETRLSISQNTIINVSDNSEKSLFSSPTSSINVIDDTLNATNKIKQTDNFVTRRRGSSKTLKDVSLQTTSLHEWERFSRNNISTIKINTTQNNSTDIIDDSVTQNIFLKPGKQWFRSLSILRRTNIHNNLDNSTNKGRKWRDSVCALLDQQRRPSEAQQQLKGVLIDTPDKQQNEIFNITTKNLHTFSLSRRTTLQIVPIQSKEISNGRNVSILEDCVLNKTGYVSTLADESQSILASFDKLSLTTDVDEREETSRQIILKRCGQTHPLPFDDCYSKRLLTRCRKIGEGVYGEVFMYKSLDRHCRVMKIIPIEGNLVVNGEHQKKFEEIISEIIIASELSNLRNNKEFSTNGFNELLKICCVQGKYPQHLLDLWNLYDEEQGSENDSPDIFTDEQLYIVLELANGGQDLEAYRFNNAEQSYAVFAQVVCSLAVAESALQFEHRDMHWGNLLISPTNETTTSFLLNGRELEIATKGVNVSIIDFTLSRMTYNNCCIFNDLALDPDLFTATGDYQFDIYRLMRKRNQDDWQRFEPYSNILWLDYTLEKMITQLRYLRINTKTHKTNIRRLTQMRKKICNYNSATELLNSDAFSQVFLY